ncbi:plastocyanin/azurin family copper-binding protein [Halobacterium jilantaiense]|uniref:Plastocyanin n=1 Tax=Halobacterium jilantaiense TaxID=355548 RepID=A0A1I0QRQ9_9EURY|nr:plastocyanin/azurin family copper-binding protein [Halobacterium jilantaiense]SEW30221.1 Plastocyanin [Halobacterium jilantaiense]
MEPPATSGLTRRDVLRGAASATALGLAGCLGGGGSESSDASGDIADALDAPDGTEVVEVGPDDEYVYAPDDLTVAPGTAVRFVWLSSGHDLNVKRQPATADWTGVQKLASRGATHEVTFDATGVYEYVCTPHASYGMRGRVRVDPDA